MKTGNKSSGNRRQCIKKIGAMSTCPIMSVEFLLDVSLLYSVKKTTTLETLLRVIAYTRLSDKDKFQAADWLRSPPAI